MKRSSAGSWLVSTVLGERAVKRKVNGEDRVATYAPAGKLPEIIEAFEKAKKASSKAEIVGLINDFDLRVRRSRLSGSTSWRFGIPCCSACRLTGPWCATWARCRRWAW